MSMVLIIAYIIMSINDYPFILYNKGVLMVRVVDITILFFILSLSIDFVWYYKYFSLICCFLYFVTKPF